MLIRVEFRKLIDIYLCHDWGIILTEIQRRVELFGANVALDFRISWLMGFNEPSFGEMNYVWTFSVNVSLTSWKDICALVKTKWRQTKLPPIRSNTNVTANSNAFNRLTQWYSYNTERVKWNLSRGLLVCDDVWCCGR